MDSRLVFPSSLPVRDENEIQLMGSWIPATPQKPIPVRFNSMPVVRPGNQLNHGNWQGMCVPGRNIQQVPRYIGRGLAQPRQTDTMVVPQIGQVENLAIPQFAQIGRMGSNANHLSSPIGRMPTNADHFAGQLGRLGSKTDHFGGGNASAATNRLSNCIAGSCQPAFEDVNIAWARLLGMNGAAPAAAPYRTLVSTVNMATYPAPQNLQSQINWRQGSLGKSLLSNQSCSSTTDIYRSHDSSTLQSRNELPIPHHPWYDLNTAPRMANDANSCISSSQQAANSTHVAALNNILASMPTNTSRPSATEGQGTQCNSLLPTEYEARDNPSDGLLQNILSSLSTAVAPLASEEPIVIESVESGKGIDLNQTPAKKPPNQRKPRPEVMKEAKSKRAKNIATAESSNSEEKQTGKRKYVRKAMEESAVEDAERPAGIRIIPTEYEACDNQSDGLLQNILSSLSAAAAPPASEEPRVIESVERGKGIDLNQTPAKKPPKRRKHRAKVVKEAKPKRAKTVATAKSSNSEEKQTGKRKYVRKAMKDSAVEDAKPTGKKYVHKKHEASAAQQEDPFEGTSNSNGDFPGNSCRRPLNFDIDPAKVEKQGTVEAPKMQMMNNKEIHVNADFITTEASLGANSMDRTNLESQISQLSQSLHGIRPSPVLAHHIHSLNKIISGCVNLSTGQTAANRAQGSHEEVNGPTTDKGIDMTEEQLRQTNLQPVPRMSSHPVEGQSSKRKHHHMEIGRDYNSNSEDSVSVHRDNHWQFKKLTSATCSETLTKYKLLTEGYSGANAMSSHAKAARVSSSSSPKAATDAVNHRHNDRISKTSYNQWVLAANTFSKSYIAPDAYNRTERTGKCNGPRNFASSTRTNNIFQPNPEARATHEDQILSRACHTDMLKQQRTGPLTEYTLNPKGNINRVEKQKEIPQAPQHQSNCQEGEQAGDPAMEAIISQMANLYLSNRTSEVENKEQYALVPYKGDGKIVPYEGFELVKKRKPRPKVDLDQETERVWKLLMEKGESDEPGEMDKEKEKWWEEERRVFHGRADSFIARMHLVQGDRRFSKWKGSVVDSVIGVFLTQNVSDHLSSSAFMSLAAKFPPKSNNTSGRESTDISKETRETIKWIEELLSSSHSDQSNLTLHEPTLFFENYETSWIENSCMGGIYGQNQEEEVLSSQGSSDSIIVQATGGVGSYSGSNSEAEELASGCEPNRSLDFSSTDNLHLKNTNLFEGHHCGSIDSLVLHEQSWIQNKQEILRDRMQMPRMNKDSCIFPQPTFGTFTEMQRSDFPSCNNGWHTTAESEILQGEGLGFSAEESMSSFPLLSSIFSKEKDTTNASKGFGQTAKMMNIATHQWERQSDESIQVASPTCLLNEPQQFKPTNCQPHHYRTQILAEEETSHSETEFSNKPANLARAPAAQQNQWSQHSDISNPKGNIVDIEDVILVSDKKLEIGNKMQRQTSELYSTIRVTAGTSKKPPKAKKGKANGGQKDATDWDSLRKEAQATNGIRERSKETMDSLDYEALRSASVREVSEAIKERGMNNMLAERIKEFLDRLVQEHGSIDLEWLRDVPPEKAKDYLLSVRGLGLKSVECVRLLTLHHLAFPVDTNVGRIAVRLGWVPIQPLPESLQLHLLELYPVLETIQKYLWPRLCKLDQRTLYELHYQLITFGKVFCTKSRPNCNACPMRAECRHFASAFASARLALPGPEEKSLTMSISPLNNKRNHGMVINRMPLLQAFDNLLKRADSCIPIIEEPATPELEESQVIESDIEDAVTEDSDEIPSINLNMEQLTENVQNFMHGGDMSKALVVIHPNAASIPTPKLKNVSRLRTEHQVYELPDSHPLLEEMDKRETDDPSPYLLAIWTPGETSETIQQPGQECECHKTDKLCNNKTCFKCNSIREANSEIVRGTLLIPCRTAMKGSFPLNGTYFQVNEVFADHKSSMDPITVPRAWLWNLPRRTVYFGTSCTSIFKGLSTLNIQQCFWKGFVCVRGFEQETRAPRPLVARLHFTASKVAKAKNDKK